MAKCRSLMANGTPRSRPSAAGSGSTTVVMAFQLGVALVDAGHGGLQHLGLRHLAGPNGIGQPTASVRSNKSSMAATLAVDCRANTGEGLAPVPSRWTTVEGDRRQPSALDGKGEQSWAQGSLRRLSPNGRQAWAPTRSSCSPPTTPPALAWPTRPGPISFWWATRWPWWFWATTTP